MLGAFIGDVIGAPYEWDNMRQEDFPLFIKTSQYTDDSVMTAATALALLKHIDYAPIYKAFGKKYPNKGYGGNFYQWIFSSNMGPYNSYGNGSAMRVSPIGYAFNDVDKVLEEAKNTAIVTHNHPEGIKGAQSTALAIFMGRTGSSKDEIKAKIVSDFGYDLNRTCSDIRPTYEFNETCQGSVPEAIVAFLDSSSFEDAIRKAVSIGGDSDTIACITGSIAEAFYKTIPQSIARETIRRLPKVFVKIIRLFYNTYSIPTRFTAK
jgi:ADP-ribosylglycohydrolase